MRCIKKPKLSVCPNKTTKYPPANTNPLDHINAYSIKHSNGILGISYDGYIVHKESKDITHFLILREYYTKCEIEKNLQQIIDEILCKNKLCKARISVANQMGIPFSAFLIPEDYPSMNNEKSAYIIKDISNCCDFTKSIFIKSDMNKFINFIDDFRGGKYRKKAKGLNSANTKFECFLANNDGYTPFPGDLDGLLIYENKVLAILEFKTHNLNTPIENQYLGQYGKADWRRIEVLHNLKTKLDVPIYVIFWGTNHSKIKIDKVTKIGKIEESKVVVWNDFVKTLLSMINIC